MQRSKNVWIRKTHWSNDWGKLKEKRDICIFNYWSLFNRFMNNEAGSTLALPVGKLFSHINNRFFFPCDWYIIPPWRCSQTEYNQDALQLHCNPDTMHIACKVLRLNNFDQGRICLKCKQLAKISDLKVQRRDFYCLRTLQFKKTKMQISTHFQNFLTWHTAVYT